MNDNLLEYLGICAVVFLIISVKAIYCAFKYKDIDFYKRSYRTDTSVLMLFMIIPIIIDKFL